MHYIDIAHAIISTLAHFGRLDATDVADGLAALGGLRRLKEGVIPRDLFEALEKAVKSGLSEWGSKVEDEVLHLSDPIDWIRGHNRFLRSGRASAEEASGLLWSLDWILLAGREARLHSVPMNRLEAVYEMALAELLPELRRGAGAYRVLQDMVAREVAGCECPATTAPVLWAVYQGLLKCLPPAAVFAIAQPDEAGPGWLAAVSRPGDIDTALPGGKLEAGESPRQALRREAAEEGWILYGVHKSPVHRDFVDGRPVWWYLTDRAVRVEPRDEDRVRGIGPCLVHRSAFGAEVDPDDRLRNKAALLAAYGA